MNIDSGLSPEDVVRWALAQADKYSRLARQIQADFGLNSAKSDAAPEDNGQRGASLESYMRAQNLRKIREFLGDKAKRAVEIAEATGLTEDAIEELATEPSSGLLAGQRGWIRQAETPA